MGYRKQKGEIRMKRITRVFSLFMTAVFVLGMCFPSFAASSKKQAVYVKTKEVSRDVLGNYYTQTMTYDKKGLLKSSKYSDSSRVSTKEKFTNKKNQASKKEYTEYEHGALTEREEIRYTYTKKGYVNTEKYYYKIKVKKKWKYFLNYAVYFDWNSAGQCVHEEHYDFEDDITTDIYYKYDSKGNLIEEIHESSESEAPSITRYEIEDKGDTVIRKEYSSSGTLNSIYYDTIKNGNVVKTVIYDSSGNYYETIDYTYKLVKTKYAPKVRFQQKHLDIFVE